MFPIALGYVGFHAESLDDWRSYGSRMLGFQLVDKSRKTLAFRMDDRKQRIIVESDGGKGVKVAGWEVADAAALKSLADRLEMRGISFSVGSRALAEERRVKELLVLSDPLGCRVEIFHGGEIATDPFKPGRSISGFRTGPLGLGHIVMGVERIGEVAAFYEDVLGFGLTDFYSHPFPARFLHVNERHHSLAFVQSGRTGLHHMMIELFSLDDVGQGLDLANEEEGKLAVSLGRHVGDSITSFYTWTPSAFMIEYGWGGRSIDPKTWRAKERREGPSLWGHERSWLPPEKRAAARASRLKNGEDGVRQPVHVIDGNYERMAGVCPWWESLAQSHIK
jgi:2,3-dihydroxybiphenyl 1,2-dioxygenase